MADEKEIQESLRWEYREVAANHRFYVGLRFIIAAFTATLHSTLLTFYNNANEVLRKAQEAGQVLGINLGEWHIPADVQVPMIAAVGVTTIVAFGWRGGILIA